MLMVSWDRFQVHRAWLFFLRYLLLGVVLLLGVFLLLLKTLDG
jgi:hypothetical protein